MKTTAIDEWTRERVAKLMRRLSALRAETDRLPEDLALHALNQRTIADLERKLDQAQSFLAATIRVTLMENSICALHHGEKGVKK
jgi:hypothetical protein